MKSTLNIHWQDWCWRWGLNTLAPNVKSWLIRKDPDAGKDWRQEEKGMTEDKVVGWHQWTWVWENSGRWWRTGKPGMLQSMGRKESHMTDQLNNNMDKILNKNTQLFKGIRTLPRRWAFVKLRSRKWVSLEFGASQRGKVDWISVWRHNSW